MQTMSANWAGRIGTDHRRLKGKAEFYRGAALMYTYTRENGLRAVVIETDAVQLFGFAASQKLTVTLYDEDGAVTAEKGDICQVYLGTETETGEEYAGRCRFYVEECTRKGNSVTITAYDALAALAGRDVIGNLDMAAPFTVREYAASIAAHMGLTAVFDTDACNNLTYTEDALPNLSGRETMRSVLQSIAEVTGTVCYMDADNRIRFRVPSDTIAKTVTKANYFRTSAGNAMKLTGVTSATELGDNVTAGDSTGVNRILWENPFVVNRSDIPDILSAILTQFGQLGFDPVPYTIKWRGDPAVEYGDTVVIIQDDGSAVNILYLGETLRFDGGLGAESSFDAPQEETPQSSPATVGERINQTVARVDKVNNEIILLSQTSSENAENIASIKNDSNEIKSAVSRLEIDNDTSKKQITELVQKSSSIELSVQSIQEDGVYKVTTSTGFTFDENGMTVEKSGAGTKTTVDETGLTVADANGATAEELLYAGVDSETGESVVKAKNIRVSKYLVVGKNSRFEDYEADGEQRTGCFFIG